MIDRPKNRYVLIEASEALDSRNVAVALDIMSSITRELGAVGCSRANPKIVYQLGDRSFVVRVNRGYEGDLILATSFIKSVCGRRVGLFTIKTSGTIRKLVTSFRKS